MARKTVKIKLLIDKVNDLNRTSLVSPEIRIGWNSLLEDILHEADVYHGFAYLNQDEVPKGQLPGVVYGDKPENNEFPDDSRRYFFCHGKLYR